MWKPLQMVVTFVALGVSAFPCRAQSTVELEKLHWIGKMVSERRVVLHDPRGKAEPWCPALLEDLRKGGKQLSVVEPRFITNDPNDPRLKPYNTCSADGERRQRLERTLTDDSGANFWGVSSLGNYGFRVYDVTDPGTQDTAQVVYGEFDRKKALSNEFPGYTIANLNHCRFERNVVVRNGMQYGLTYAGPPRESHNLMVSYLNRYFVLDAYDMRMSTETKPLFWVRLSPLFETSSVSCWWSAS